MMYQAVSHEGLRLMRPKLLCYPGFKGGASFLELASLLNTFEASTVLFYDDADAGSRTIRPGYLTGLSQMLQGLS